jgi:prepilin signal peptidase PulO-like enzyme (type II secretory pathway)
VNSEFVFVPFAFIAGAILGSWGCLLVSRSGSESLSWYRTNIPSQCDYCGAFLSWWEKIPILGYALLLGKCRTCKRSISIALPLIEFLNACSLALAIYLLLRSPIAGLFAILNWGILISFTNKEGYSEAPLWLPTWVGTLGWLLSWVALLGPKFNGVLVLEMVPVMLLCLVTALVFHIFASRPSYVTDTKRRQLIALSILPYFCFTPSLMLVLPMLLSLLIPGLARLRRFCVQKRVVFYAILFVAEALAVLARA